MNILVTGATGFLGSGLLSKLAETSLVAFGAVRQLGVPLPGGAPSRFVGDLSPNTDWRTAVSGMDTVVHCAARVHVMRDNSADPLAEFRIANVEGTLALARQAVEAGVRRLVYVSSIKVNGESTMPGRPFRADTPPAPRDAYGISKMEAEGCLREFADSSGLEVVIIRPVLVYGPGVKGNFRSLLRLLERGVPLPLASVDNRRSLVGLDNLIDLIITCVVHERAVNRTFLVSDGEDLSTTDLLRRAAVALGRSPRLIPIPPAALSLAGRILGRGAAAQRVLSTLQVDIAATREILGWSPQVSVDEGLRRAVKGFSRTL